MRLYLSVDMEGLAGVAHPYQVSYKLGRNDRVDYDRSRALMAGETNAAIEAALGAGCDEIVVNDSHWEMRNLRAEDLLPTARLIVGDKPMSMTEGIGAEDGSFDAAAFVGYHAGAGNPTGVIGHTYSSATILGVRVDDVPHNEAGLNALRLGHFGVPVMLVAGDDALAAEIELLLPWAERVVVKQARGYGLADSLSPTAAQAAIADGMRRALGRLGEMVVYRREAPMAIEVDVRLPVMADYAAVLPEVERIGPRTIGFRADDGDELFRRFISVVRLTSAPSV